MTSTPCRNTHYISENITSMGSHGGMKVLGPGHALVGSLTPRLVAGEPLGRRLLGRVGGPRARLARVGVGVGIGHPRTHRGGHTTPGAGVQKVASAATSPATRAEMVTSLVVERGKLGRHKQGSSHDTYPLNPSLVAFCTPNEIV